MARTAILKIDIISDARKANTEFDKVSKKTEAIEKAWGTVDRAATAGGAALVGLGVMAAKSAAQAEQAVGGVESVFKDYASNVAEFADQSARSVGLSETQYNEFAARIGAQFKNLGVPMDELAGKTDDLIGRAADLAATFGGSTADAVDALSAAFRGEFDPIEKYGIAIRKSDVNARLAAQGLGDLEGAALKSAEQQAIWSMIMEQSADSSGQFAREAETASGSYAILTAEWENAKAELGMALLPLLADLAEHLADAARWVTENKEAVEKWLIVAGGIIGTIKTISWGIALYKTVSAGVKTLGALFGFGQAATAAASAGTVATAHATAATGTSAAWATSATASGTSLAGLATAAGIEAAIISGALAGAAGAASIAFGLAAGSIGGDLDDVRDKSTEAADTARTAWDGVFTGAAGDLGWLAWNAAAVGEHIKNQTSTVPEWGAAWTSSANSAAWAVAALADQLDRANITGGPIIDLFNRAAAAAEVWGRVALIAAETVTAYLGAVRGVIGGVASAFGLAEQPAGLLGRAGALAGDAIAGGMDVALSWIEAVTRAVQTAIRALQRMIEWARAAASWDNVFDGGLFGRLSAGAADPEFTGAAATPPGVLFAAAGPTWLGTISPSTAGRAQTSPVTYNVTVNGALDPVAVADQIRDVIEYTDRTRGLVGAQGGRR
ncbi:hypothetical protein [Dietzia sp. 179-F 9C3 NHS]|uniref:hypothetical protein n=1 Tax=Dietzia sp. 179-F 9C3 NHS TaxID=3374295 RepID=UPI00387900EE